MGSSLIYLSKNCFKKIKKIIFKKKLNCKKKKKKNRSSVNSIVIFPIIKTWNVKGC